MNDPQDLPPPLIPPSRSRARMLDGTAVAVIALAVLYACMPLWLPTGLLQRQIVHQLSADLRRPVHIGGLDVSWRTGIAVRDVTVSERPGGPNPLLARIRTVQCAFTPLRTLWTGRVRQMEFTDAELWLVRDETGRLNVADLDQKRESNLPCLSYVLTSGACHVWTPESRQTFRIDQLECQLEPATGVLHLFGQAVVNRAPGEPLASNGRFTLHARLKVPRLKRDEDLRGRIRAEWANLSMTDLPLVLIPRLPVEQVSGATSGRIELTTQPDLQVDYGLSISFNGVQIRREGVAHPAQVPDAELSCSGRWDPNPRSDVVVMEEFDYETPALRVTRRRDPPTPVPAVLIDADGETALALNLAGTVKDWQGLRREFPEFDTVAESVGLICEGAAAFTFTVNEQREEERLQITIDAPDSVIRLSGADQPLITAGRGVPKSLALEVRRNRITRQVSQPQTRLTIGDLEVNLRAAVDIPDPQPTDPLEWVTDILPTLQTELSVQTADVARALPLLPVLERIPGIEDWKGPLRLAASLQPETDAARLKLSLTLDADSGVRVTDLFSKPPGEALSIDAGALVPHVASGRISGMWFDLNHGAARVRVDPSKAVADYRFRAINDEAAPHEAVALYAGMEVPVHLERVERLLPLSPALHAALAGRGVFSGTADAILRGTLASEPGDRLLRTEVELIADAMGVRWGDLLDKPEGGSMRITAAHTLRELGGAREQSLRATVNQPAGLLQASLTFAGADSADMQDDFEYLSVSADIRDLQAMLAISPLLRESAAAAEAAGALRVEVESILSGEEQNVSLAVDATRAEFIALGDLPLTKPVGVPASAVMRLETTWGAAAEGKQVWRLEDSRAALAGAEVAQISGELITTAGARGLQAFDVLSGLAAAPRFEGATLKGAGVLTFDGATAAMHPAIGELCEELALGGSSAWTIDVRARPGEVALAGRVDAGNAGFVIPLHSDMVPTLRKEHAGRMEARFNAALSHLDGGAGYRVDLRDFKLDLEGNSLALSGGFDVPHREAGVEAGDLSLAGSLVLQEPSELLKLLRDSVIDRLDGRCRAELRLARTAGEIDVELGEVRFDSFLVSAGGEPLRLDGAAVVSASAIDFDQLDWKWGRSEGLLSGTLHREGDRHRGQLGLAFDRLDMDDLRERLAELPSPGMTAPGDSAGSRDRMAELLQRVGRSKVVVDANFARVNLRLPLDVTVLAQAASARAAVDEGPLSLNFRCMVDGGVVNGDFAANLESADPSFHLTYTASRIQPGEVVDTYLKLTFPGMTASGPLTLIDESIQKLLPAEGDPNWPTGSGEIIIEGGTIEGRAAPKWVTNIFPGLNMSRFDFSYMHSWFEKYATGRVRHQMIYQGSIYNIYTIGYSEPDGRIDYEVGIDFFADFDSKYWAESGQGRVPLFRKTGRKLEDGRLVDEVVTYVPPQRIFNTLFVRNNPLVTAYHAVRKRVLREQ